MISQGEGDSETVSIRERGIHCWLEDPEEMTKMQSRSHTEKSAPKRNSVPHTLEAKRQ